jgi:hypothetical protein
MRLARGISTKGLLERGAEWKRVRSFMQTDLLHPESARGYVPGMIRAAELASAGACASRKAINEYLGRCAFDLFTTIMFGELTEVADPTTPTDPQNVKFAAEAAAGLGASVQMLFDPYELRMHKLGVTTTKCQYCFAAFDATWEIAQAKIDSFCERRERNEFDRKRAELLPLSSIRPTVGSFQPSDGSRSERTLLLSAFCGY